MMKPYLLVVLYCLCFTTSLSAQTIKTIDVVKVNANYEKEAMYFYHENWKAFREAALEKKVISGYELLRTPTDSTNHFQLLLITEYADSLSYKNLEKNFEPIMKAIAPQGPKMLNAVSRKDFLEYIIGFDAYSLLEKRRIKKSK